MLKQGAQATNPKLEQHKEVPPAHMQAPPEPKHTLPEPMQQCNMECIKVQKPTHSAQGG
jgi:hypothetical protein